MFLLYLLLAVNFPVPTAPLHSSSHATRTYSERVPPPPCSAGLELSGSLWCNCWSAAGAEPHSLVASTSLKERGLLLLAFLSSSLRSPASAAHCALSLAKLTSGIISGGRRRRGGWVEKEEEGMGGEWGEGWMYRTWGGGLQHCKGKEWGSYIFEFPINIVIKEIFRWSFDLCASATHGIWIWRDNRSQLQVHYGCIKPKNCVTGIVLSHY